MGTLGTKIDAVKQLYGRQMESWPEFSVRCRELSGVEKTSVSIDHNLYYVYFNRARQVSARADVSRDAIAARPCFLCRANRPAEQERLSVAGFDLCVNPFPITVEHFTIIHPEHTAQSIQGNVERMVELARLLPGMAVFYNGPECGASAPDHFHFQAAPLDYFPALRPVRTKRLKLREAPGWCIILHPDMPVTPVKIEGTDIVPAVYAVLDSLPAVSGKEPMVNIMAWHDGEKDCITVFPRGAHRPASYNAAGGDGTTMFSPGAADVAGCVVTVNERDYRLMESERLKALLEEVSLRKQQIDKFILDILSYAI